MRNEISEFEHTHPPSPPPLPNGPAFREGTVMGMARGRRKQWRRPRERKGTQIKFPVVQEEEEGEEGDMAKKEGGEEMKWPRGKGKGWVGRKNMIRPMGRESREIMRGRGEREEGERGREIMDDEKEKDAEEKGVSETEAEEGNPGGGGKQKACRVCFHYELFNWISKPASTITTTPRRNICK